MLERLCAECGKPIFKNTGGAWNHMTVIDFLACGVARPAEPEVAPQCAYLGCGQLESALIHANPHEDGHYFVHAVPEAVAPDPEKLYGFIPSGGQEIVKPVAVPTNAIERAARKIVDFHHFHLQERDYATVLSLLNYELIQREKPKTLTEAAKEGREKWQAIHGKCTMCAAGDTPVNGIHREKYRCGDEEPANAPGAHSVKEEKS